MKKKNTKIFLSILSIFMYFFVNRKQKADLQTSGIQICHKTEFSFCKKYWIFW